MFQSFPIWVDYILCIMCLVQHCGVFPDEQNEFIFHLYKETRKKSHDPCGAVARFKGSATAEIAGPKGAGARQRYLQTA